MQFRTNRPQGLPPSDAETAEYARELAELFVEHTREDGYAFDWDPALIHHLDKYCGEFAAQKPPQEILDSVIISAGAYFGEMIVRNGEGVWAYDVEQSAACVDMPNGRNWPQNKVAKRILQGPQHDLAAFYKYVTTGATPVGVTTRVIKPCCGNA